MNVEKGREQSSDSNQPKARSRQPSLFCALSQTQLVRDYLDAFRKANHIKLQFLPADSAFVIHHAQPGIMHLAVPVVVEGQHAATFLSEPVGVGRVEGWKAGNGPTTARAVSESEFRALERLLSIFAQHLSCFANRYLIAHRHDEPACVTQAKEFIEQHASEPLRLDQIARHARVSGKHLSKLFGKATGMTLREYVRRCRVERAGELLLQTDTRISEIAFACGFESIPNFNRVFRKVVGMSPSVFRAEDREAARGKG